MLAFNEESPVNLSPKNRKKRDRNQILKYSCHKTRQINIIHKIRLINYLNGMPQLDFLSYSSQLIGLLTIFSIFYILTLKSTLPSLKEIQKVRTLLTKTEQEENLPLETETTVLKEIRTLLEQNQKLCQIQGTHLLKGTNQKSFKKISKDYLLQLSQLLIKKHGI